MTADWDNLVGIFILRNLVEDIKQIQGKTYIEKRQSLKK
ncbi:hypothetical protein RV11_GL001068 [Enterococcus phoeniculicola]|nr:hypothetical protein RV11_GL001068 [Enterococcus phoeniculicola]